MDVLRIVQLDPGTERWLGFARQKARAFIQEIHAKASSAKPPDGFTKTIRPEQGVTIHLIGSYHGTDWIVKVFVVGGGSATFFHNENGSPSFDDYDFSDQHVASECVRGGLFVQKPAHRRYPIEALAKLLAAKRWGIAWFWCNTYFAAEGVPCAYLKTGWEASTVGTDVLVVDAGKVIGWDFYDSDYPPHDRLNSEEEQEHFATPITAEEVTALLGPFLGEFVSDEGDFFPDGGAFPTPTLPSGAISFVEDATGELPMPPITLESKRWWRLPHADGPYDHDGEYIVETIVTVESFQWCEHLPTLPAPGSGWVRSGLTSTVSLERTRYRRTVAGHQVLGVDPVARTALGARVATERTWTVGSLTNPHFDIPGFYRVEKSGEWINGGEHEFAFQALVETSPGIFGLVTDPPVSSHLNPANTSDFLTRLSSGGYFTGTVLPFPAGTIDREFLAPNGDIHRQYVDGTYTITRPGEEGEPEQVLLETPRQITNELIFDQNSGWALGLMNVVMEVTQSVVVTEVPNELLPPYFVEVRIEHSSTESAYLVDDKPLEASAFTHPRVFPIVDDDSFLPFKHFLYRPVSGAVLVADFLEGESEVSPSELEELEALRAAWIEERSAANLEAFVERFDVLLARGVDRTFLMNSFFGQGPVFVI